MVFKILTKAPGTLSIQHKTFELSQKAKWLVTSNA